jgi:heme-degrading monooxygenase HmoA
MPSAEPQQLVHINIFKPLAGKLDEFIATHLDGLAALGDIPGSRGSRLYRANDGSQAILIALFDDEESHRRFMETPAFHRHRQRILPLVEKTTPGYYTLVYSRDVP